MTPQDYLQKKFAGYTKMTQADFEAGNIRGLFQADQIEEAQIKLDRDVEAWGTQLDMMHAGTLNTRQEMTMLNQTPLVLQMLGAKNWPVKIAPGKLKRAIKKHNLPIEVVKQIPASLTDPVLVFKSATHEGDLLMMLELKDSTNEGATINVPIALELKDTTGYEANIATTVFGRRDKSGRPDNQWFVKQVSDGNLIYKNNKKIRDWARTSKVQFLGANSRTINGKQKIYTEADLVNLRLANPGMYQGNSFTARGAMSTLTDGRHFVALFEHQDASTVLHETAHYFMEQLREAHALANAPEWVNEAWQKIEKAYGFNEWTLDRESWTSAQERFAREFEAYCRDGKAPSPELQTAFNRFRKWLTTIYKSVRSILGLNEVSKDVRQVFDRLLATEEEIAESRRAMEDKSAMNLPGIGGKLMERYLKAIDKARNTVDAAFSNRRLVERRQAERDIRTQATADIDANQTYQTVAEMRKEGLPIEALQAVLDENLVNGLRYKWRAERGSGRALLRKGGTMDLMQAAANLGYNNVQELAAGLANLPTRNQAIENEVNKRLAEWDANYDVEVEYSAAYDEALAIEIQALTGKQQMSPKALLQLMEERAGAKPLVDLDAEYRSLRAKLRADERLSRRAYNEGSKEASAKWSERHKEAMGEQRQKRKDQAENWRQRLAELKQRERIRRAALQADYRAKIESGNIIRSLRKIAASKTIPYDYRQQIRAIMSHWDGLGTPAMALSRDELTATPSIDVFLDQLKKSSPFGEPITAAQWLIDSLKNKRGSTGLRFNALSIEQMRDVKSLVRELAQAGRNHDRMLAADRKFTIQNVSEMCAAQMDKLSARTYHSERDNIISKGFGKIRGCLSDMTAMRFLVRALDGFRDHGINHDSWFNPLQQARSKELALRRKVYDKVREAIKPLMANSSQIHKAFAIDDVVLPEDVAREWGGLWDMDKVYSVALNMGNEGNINALQGGYGFDAAALQKITARMTSEQWQAVQNIWDAIDTLYPELDAVYRELKGNPLPKVKNQPFTVTTADGKTMRLKGGYYPLVFDHKFSKKAAENQSVDEMLNGMENIVRSPNPQSGMTKERKGGKLPPKLSMSVMDRHLTDTIHYVTHALPLRDVNSLFNNQTFKDAFIEHAGKENYEQLLPWLRGIARPDGERLSGPVRAMQWLANRGATFALGASFRTALLQLTSIGNSLNEVGAANFLAASSKLLLHPVETYSAIREKSAYMQERAKLFDDTMRRDYQEMQARGYGGVRFKGARYSLDTLRQAQMGLMIAMDTAVTAPTWLAAYEKNIKAGLSEDAAVAAADSAVVAAQGGGGALDTPGVLRQATWLRVVCPFMSFAMSDFNRKMYHVRGVAEWMKTGNSAINPGVFMRHFALEWALPVFLTCMLTSLGKDDELPDTEDYLWEALTFYAMGIPIVRDAANLAKDNFSSGPKAGSRSPLIYSGIDNLFRGASHTWKAIKENDPDAKNKAIKEMTNAVGFATGLGTPQIFRTWEGTQAYLEGEGGFLSPLLGKPSKK